MFELIQKRMPWLAGVMLILIAGFSFIMYKGKDYEVEINEDQMMEEIVEDDQVVQPKVYQPGSDPTAEPKGLTYEEAIAAHQNSRLQLNNCVAKPSILNLKNDSTIMLDGLSPDPQVITIGDRKVVLEGYEFSLIRLTESSVPVTLSLDCEITGRPSYNIATINLQP